MNTVKIKKWMENTLRTIRRAFGGKTGRNQPSNNKFIFGSSVWLHSPIKPIKGWGINYIDWFQQEFGIAAALSSESVMKQAYASVDPYLEFS